MPLPSSETVEQRVELWAAATDLLSDHPLDGVGPGRFAAVSPVSDDPDLRWAHHDFLQYGAEQGIVGLALLLALLGWLHWRLWSVQDGSITVALGAIPLATVGLAATVDHILGEPAVVVLAAVLLGGGTGTNRDVLTTGGPTGRSVRST